MNAPLRRRTGKGNARSNWVLPRIRIQALFLALLLLPLGQPARTQGSQTPPNAMQLQGQVRLSYAFGSQEQVVFCTIVEPTGRVTVDCDSLREAAGTSLPQLSDAFVQVIAEASPTSVRGGSVRLVRSAKIVSAPYLNAPIETMTGVKKWLTIPCNYAAGSFPDSPRSIAQIRDIVGLDGSSAYPTLNHYWRAASNQQLLMQMYVNDSWLRLPKPPGEYFGSNPSLFTVEDAWDPVVEDCVQALAPGQDISVLRTYLQDFHGVTVLLNGTWGSPNIAAGFGAFTSRLSFANDRRIGVSILQYQPLTLSWTNPAVLSHEVGHGLSLAHPPALPNNLTTDPNPATPNIGQLFYKDRFDIMGSIECCTPVHPAAWHKWKLGWLQN